MKSKYFRNSRPYCKYGLLSVQQKNIEKFFPFLQCNIDRKNILTCIGWVQPDGCKTRYKVKIECVVGHEPKTTVLHPKIEPGIKIHMYQDHSLCLHYTPDMHWSEKTAIYKYTIPWLCEWLIFYELFLVNGNIWLGRESPIHMTEEDKNINKDI